MVACVAQEFGLNDAANHFEAENYKDLSGEVRVETVQLLREIHFKSMGLKFSEDGKRLRGVLSVITQT